MNYPEILKDYFKRYLKIIKNYFGMDGLPLKIIFKKSENPSMQNKIIYMFFFFYFSQISNVESDSINFYNSENYKMCHGKIIKVINI